MIEPSLVAIVSEKEVESLQTFDERDLRVNSGTR